MRSRKSALLTLTGAAAVLAYSAYRKDLTLARQRVDGKRQFIKTADSTIEFAESGNGPAILVIHGAGGGFDQGLDLGHEFFGDDFRIIAPSRFGYLGTPLPFDASPQAQADAHVRVLDALHIDRVPVVGVSAGAPSALQLALKYPDRCSALLLIVPLVYAPKHATPSRPLSAWLNAIMRSDFVFWSTTRVAHSFSLKTILGTPIEVYRKASDVDRRRLDDMLRTILPVSRRADGINNDGIVADSLMPSNLASLHVPTLIISAEDCLYGTCEPSRFTASQIPRAKFVSFPTGGHLLTGHSTEVKAHIAEFLQKVNTPAEMVI
jgi:pimeloyl-ACP methyl ester carboxylesterase